MASVCSVLANFKEKIETAVAMVPTMCAEDKLKAVQLWNILSERLQEIVNNSAADINALAFQEPTQETGNFYFYHQSKIAQSNNIEDIGDNFGNGDNTSLLKSPIGDPTEADNSLASFSDIQCADEEDMDNVCPLSLPISLEDKSETIPPSEKIDFEKEKSKLFECAECKATFRTKGHLAEHSRKHTGERPFHCSDCGSSFTTHSNLKRHRKSHTGDKTWTCQECHAKFLEKKTLLVHMRRHTGEKPYQCVVCSKRFSQLSILQSHLALHSNERGHLCELCGKSFHQKSQMKTHLLRHKGERRFQCSDCSMAFLTKSDFRRHLRVHTGERPFVCDICGKKFTRMETLNEHKNRHLGIKPYVCNICSKEFSESSAFGKHMKKHNGTAHSSNKSANSVPVLS